MHTVFTDLLRLPCGAVLSNRIAKSAITEGLADACGWPTADLERLYGGWADGGFGLMITGNVIVDRDHLERPGNVIIDGEPSAGRRAALSSWTVSARSGGAHLWAQLSHSGRQTPKALNAHPKSPSAIKVDLPGGLFGQPTAMNEDEIAKVIEKFATAARVCKETGFSGVQIHAAHGYLLASFLSPSANRRTDQWGGSLKNRSRLLMAVVSAVRAQVGAAFPIGVKLNSADFQKGGFNPDESEQVAIGLEAAGIDLLEISGGSYESPAMIGVEGDGSEGQFARKKASTIAREAYFFEFARSLRQQLKMPIMLTGGLRSRQGMQAALDEGIDVLGVARPVCVDPRAAKQLTAGEIDALECWENRIRRDKGFFSSNSPLALVRTLNNFSGIYWFYAQLYRLGRGEPVAPALGPLKAMLQVMSTERRILAEHKRLRGTADDAAIGGLQQELAIARLRMIALTAAPSDSTERAPHDRDVA
jgi:2,4-dienoyl-CoA reductase-like NADH-dependent reductase (Old Yellow Enzyme family)